VRDGGIFARQRRLGPSASRAGALAAPARITLDTSVCASTHAAFTYSARASPRHCCSVEIKMTPTVS
jgi:hypothetical protein